MLYNGSYDNEETAARASDTLARKLMANGEQAHKLNFPDDDTDVFPDVTERFCRIIMENTLNFMSERARKRKRPQHEDLDNSKNN